jgi:DNA-binding response OmpR family regulator
MAHILVVDDDPTNASLLKMLLELDGFAVTSCSNIEEAVASAGKNVDAFVVDIHLARGANGLDLLTKIRGNETEADPNIVVIMTSGDHRLNDASLEKGASTFLLKPYSPDLLSAKLNELL